MLIKNSVHEHLVEIKVILNLKILFLLCLSIAEQKSFEWLSGDNSSAQITKQVCLYFGDFRVEKIIGSLQWMPRKKCARHMQTNYTALCSHFPFLKQYVWQSGAMEILFQLCSLTLFSCLTFGNVLWDTHHYFCLLWISTLSLLMFLINPAEYTGPGTADFQEKNNLVFRSEHRVWFFGSEVI